MRGERYEARFRVRLTTPGIIVIDDAQKQQNTDNVDHQSPVPRYMVDTKGPCDILVFGVAPRISPTSPPLQVTVSQPKMVRT